jgi:decaprenylphospho-beta-D-ribofuranose 2-oxidase
VTVTTSGATAGGTLSADCVSRFTPDYGKESVFVDEIGVLYLDGSEATLKPYEAVQPDTSLNPFWGFIGSLGYLGVVTSITYRVCRPRITELSAGFSPGGSPASEEELRRPRRVLSIIEKPAGVAGFAKLLYESIDPHLATVPPGGPVDFAVPSLQDPRACYGILAVGPFGPKGVVIRSRYACSETTSPLPQNQPDHPLRPLAEWCARSPLLGPWFWELSYQLILREGRFYIDELEGYTFFMDGNVRTRALEQKLGIESFVLQETYVVKFDPQALERFLDAAIQLIGARGTPATLIDVLRVGQDNPYLSASRGFNGFAVTVAFGVWSRAAASSVEETLRELAQICGDQGGCVHLAKTVQADPALLREMFAGGLESFKTLKDKYDPERVLRNAFLERVFPDLAAPAARPPSPST